MKTGQLEHANITVTSPERTAELLCRLFGWRIRWQGPSQLGGRTVHVGGDGSYLALYTPESDMHRAGTSYSVPGGLNHVGVLVDDIEEAERRVVDAGLEAFNHADYEPGRRFYFLDPDGIEFEVVSYGGE